MKKRGFTLIELLAVIVILAIIALIATPMILGVIDTAKKGSAKSSALGYIEAIEKSFMIGQIEGEGVPTDGVYTLSDNGKTLTSAAGDEYTVDYKGDAAEGSVYVANGGEVISASLLFSKIHQNVVKYENNTAENTTYTDTADFTVHS